VARARAARRLEGLGTSIFTEISRLAVEHNAVNLGQGFPDFAAPVFVKEAAKRAIDAEHNQYAPASGIPRLRQAIVDKWQRRYDEALDLDAEVTVTQGATEALACAILGLLNPGEEAILFEPAYDAYVPDVQMAGGVARFVQLEPPHWHLHAAAVRAAITPKTRLIIVNTPHNPTGKVWSPDDLDVIAKICVEHDLIAISDEVYSELVYDGAQHVPLATRPGMRDRTVTIDSIGKTFSVTGWKIGWAIAAPELTAALRGCHQFITFCNATPLQEAAADALIEAEGGYYNELRDAYRQRRDTLQAALHRAGLNTLPIDGAYFLLADIAPFGFENDVAFCRHLLLQAGIASIPPSSFYADTQMAPPLARFCFAKSDAALADAAQRLRNARLE